MSKPVFEDYGWGSIVCMVAVTPIVFVLMAVAWLAGLVLGPCVRRAEAAKGCGH